MPRKRLLAPVGHGISIFSSPTGQVPGALREALVQTITSSNGVMCDVHVVIKIFIIIA